MNQREKGEHFRALHEGEPFVIPNPWDAGSARMMEALGFKALTTTSSGFAFTLGKLDSAATLDEVVEHVRLMSAATSLPVAVDLENGYGDAATAITRVAEAGAVGGSIEDYDPEGGLLSLDAAVSRVSEAVAAARALDFPFTLVGRAENHLHGVDDLDNTIERLLAYEAAGRRRPVRPGSAQHRPDPRDLRGRLAAGQRPRPRRLRPVRDLRRGRAAGLGRWGVDVGGRRRRRGRLRGGPQRRPLRAHGPGAVGRLARLTQSVSPRRRTAAG